MVPPHRCWESDASDGHLCAGQTSMLHAWQWEREESLSSQAYFMLLCTHLSAYASHGELDLPEQVWYWTSNQSDTGTCQDSLPSLPSALLLPRWGGTPRTHWYLWSVSGDLERSGLCGISAVAAARRPEQSLMWGFPILTNSLALTTPTESHPVRRGAFLLPCICTPRNSFDSSVLCFSKSWSRSIIPRESAFFLN